MFLFLLIPLTSAIEELSFSSRSGDHFEVKFERGDTDIDKQYFTFQGSTDNSSYSYFYRKGKQYQLIITDGEFHEIYTAPAVDKQFTFSWPDYSINNVQMNLVLSQGELDTLDFNYYHFDSSVLQFLTLTTSDRRESSSTSRSERYLTAYFTGGKNTTFEPCSQVYSCEKTCNYYYLIIPFVICVLGSRYDLILQIYETRYGIQVENAEISSLKSVSISSIDEIAETSV